MAQYNLLGGVSPLNPEYEQQVAMRGKGTNWAEYGLRKDALKEQKKQNKFQNIMSGINTAFKAFDAYQSAKEFELKKESQDLINSEREIDIQTKRIDLDAKQTAATEDKEFLDGLMALTEAKRDNEIGAWIMSHPKAAGRNAEATWGSINRLRTTLGDSAADRLLSVALPETAEKVRQFNEQQAGADRRAYLAANTSLQVAKMNADRAAASDLARIQAANIKAQGQMYAADMKAGASIFGGFGDLAGGMSVGASSAGVVNKAKNDTYNQLLDNVSNFNNIVYNSPDMRASAMDLGILDDEGQLTINSLRDYTARGNKVIFTDVKTLAKKYETMTGLSGTDLLSYISQNGLYENVSPRRTASGEDKINPRTGERVLDMMNPLSSSVQTALTNYLKQTTETPSQESDTSGEGIIQFVDRDGRTIQAMIGTKDELKGIQDAVQSMIKYNTQLNEGAAFTENAANYFASLGTPFGDKMAELGRTKLGLQKTLQDSYRDIPAVDKTTGKVIPDMYVRQSSRLPDAPIYGNNGTVVGYTTKVNPEGQYYSQEQRDRKEKLLDSFYEQYTEDPKGALSNLANSVGLPNKDALTIDHIRQFLGKKMTQKEFDKMSPKQQEATYNNVLSVLESELQQGNIKDIAERRSLSQRESKAEENIRKVKSRNVLNGVKNILLEAVTNLEEGSSSNKVLSVFNEGNVRDKVRDALDTSLKDLDLMTLAELTDKINSLHSVLGRPRLGFRGTSEYGFDWEKTSYQRDRVRNALYNIIMGAAHRKGTLSGKGNASIKKNGQQTYQENEEEIKQILDLLDILTEGE